MERKLNHVTNRVVVIINNFPFRSEIGFKSLLGTMMEADSSQ